MKQGTPQLQQQPPLFADIVIHSASVQVANQGDKKLLRFAMPNGLAVMIPLDKTAVEALITQLRGSNITVARVTPP